jgi:NAD(P)H-nitrite reductase large subunit
MTMTNYVMIGSSIAGMSAAEAIREREAQASITLLAEEPHALYSRPGLAYLLRGDIPEKQLFARTADDLRALHLRLIKARADRVMPVEHQVLLNDGRRIGYDRLLLATGSIAVAADFAGRDLAGVVKLDNLDDARHILKLAKRSQRAIVLGGGITALELVEGLRARGLKVHYLMRGDRYWSNVLDPTESSIVEERLREEGVIIHTHSQVKQALGKDGRLTGVETQSGDKIACDLLAVAIGVRPRVELAQAAGLKIDRGLVVDEFMRTSAVDVYAAGDVAQVYDPRSGRAILNALWSAALTQGRTAGLNMAGADTPYVKPVAMNVTQLAGLVTTIIGAVGSGRDDDLVTIARGDSEAWRLLPQAWVVTDRHEVNRVRLLLDEHTIVGALVVGDQAWSRPLYQLIAQRADLTPIRSQLMADQASALTQLANFYREWEQKHCAAANV